MGCKAKTTAIAQLRRGFATLQTAQNRADRAARDLFSVALADDGIPVLLNEVGGNTYRRLAWTVGPELPQVIAVAI